MEECGALDQKSNSSLCCCSRANVARAPRWRIWCPCRGRKVAERKEKEVGWIVIKGKERKNIAHAKKGEVARRADGERKLCMLKTVRWEERRKEEKSAC